MTNELDSNFPELERQFIREKAYPEFEWMSFDGPSPINRLAKPANQSRVAIVTTCGAHLKSDPPFNLKSRIGDHSYREIPKTTDLDEVVLSHVGYNTGHVSADKNCVFPLERLRELETEGVIGALGPRQFSFMGYVAVPAPLIGETAPDVARKLKADGVDLVLLAPA